MIRTKTIVSFLSVAIFAVACGRQETTSQMPKQVGPIQPGGQDPYVNQVPNGQPNLNQGPAVDPSMNQNPGVGIQPPPMIGGASAPEPYGGLSGPMAQPPLPPRGQSGGYHHWLNYLNGLNCPITRGPVFDPRLYEVEAQAKLLHNNGYDIRQFHQTYQYFSNIQLAQNTSHHRLPNGRVAVRIVTTLMRQQGFRLDVFQQHYNHCLGMGLPPQEAMQRSFKEMRIDVRVQEFLV